MTPIEIVSYRIFGENEKEKSNMHAVCSLPSFVCLPYFTCTPIVVVDALLQTKATKRLYRHACIKGWSHGGE